ncbi:MAG: HAMP domain-containing sensor histidine kinase [Patescibacteria group bacterium]
MKLNLRSKLFLSYAVVILFTLALLSYLVEAQLSNHVQKFFKSFDGTLLPFPEKPGDVFLETIEQSTFLTVVGAAGIAIVISFLITGYITRPVNRVIRATKAIALGKYEQRVPIESSDELADLSQSLNSMAEALQRHRYLQQELITNVSHELATPLTNIGGYLEALTDGMIEDKKRAETFALMKEEVDRLSTMLTEVRTLSLLEQPKFKIKTAPLDVRDATEKILKQMEPQFEAKKVPLTLHADLTNESFTLDKDRYTQILLNLLSNALKYSPSHKPVTVKLSSKNGLTVEVADQGEGIPAKDLPYIFERFYRADQSRTRKTGGIGVGLAIVKELVEAHSGRITAQSIEGIGSTFTVSFPVAESAASKNHSATKIPADL